MFLVSGDLGLVGVLVGLGAVEGTLPTTPERCSGWLTPGVTQCDWNLVIIFPFPHLKIYEKVCLFLGAAETNDHTLGGLRTTETYLSQLGRSEF